MTAERFLARVTMEPNSGCWLWARSWRHGYGNIKVGGKVLATHRMSWEIFIGPIPPGLHVLHRCDVPCCVRPSHLWLGTPTDNTADRDHKGRCTAGAYERRRTHCPAGHAYDAANTRWSKGKRACRACHCLAARRRRAQAPATIGPVTLV